MTRTSREAIKAQAEAAGEGVIIDMTRLTYRDQMEMAKGQMLTVRYDRIRQRLTKKIGSGEDLDESEEAAFMEISDPDTIELIMQRTCQLFARVVVSFPAEWLPKVKKIAFDDPKTYEQLSPVHIEKLNSAILGGAEAPKN